MERCAALVRFSRCIGSFPASEAKAYEAELTELTGTVGCSASDFEATPLNPTIKSDDGSDLTFAVGDDKDFIFTRHRRETVSVFEINERAGIPFFWCRFLFNVCRPFIPNALIASLQVQTCLPWISPLGRS
jgi:hypothetical protein